MNPGAPIVLAARRNAWQAFLDLDVWHTADEVGEGNAPTDWIAFFDVDTLQASSAKHRLFNALSPLASRTDPLWHTAVERLLVLEDLLSLDGPAFSRGAFMVECDVMLYKPLNLRTVALSELMPSGMAVVPMSPSWSSLAVMWADRPAAVGRLNNWLMDRMLLRDGALAAITAGDAHEMRLLGAFRDQQGPSALGLLPTQPNSKATTSTGGGLFDPAGWGQFLGGTPHGDGPGFLDREHTLGAAVRMGRVRVRWNDAVSAPETRWCPYGVEGDDCVVHALFNLHVHSKNTAAFVTCGASAAAAASERSALVDTAAATLATEEAEEEAAGF